MATDLQSTPLPNPAPKTRKKWPLLLLLLAFVLLTAFVIYRQHTAVPKEQAKGRFGKDGMPTTVAVAKAYKRDVNVYLDALGTITPRNNVVVRSRVDGQLLQLFFKEGQMVKAGDLLAQIDPKTYESQLAQAAGQLARDKALLENAMIDAARYKTLLGQDSISRQQVDTQESLVRQYRGAIEVDQALVDNAKLQLGYSRITAPISGRVGLRQVDPGNMIRTSDANGIVTITQLQPITALFNIPEDDLTTVLKRMKSGTPLQVDAYDRSQQNKLAQGALLTTDNQIDTTTGTVKLRAEFANRDEMLFPNQFVNIKVLVSVEKNAIVVPSSALQHGRNGDFVYVMQREPVAEVPGDPSAAGNPDKAADAPAKPADEAAKESPPPVDANATAEAGKDRAEGGSKGFGANAPGQDGSGKGRSGTRGPGKVHLVKLTTVTTGHSDGEVTSILSGVNPGDIVVTDGADKLKDGAKVKPSMTKRGDKKPGEGKAGSSQAGDSQAAESGANDSGNGKRGHRRHNADPDAPAGQNESKEERQGASDSNASDASNPPAFKRRARDAGQDQSAEGGQGEPGMRRHGGHRERSPE